jgi:hypothetical protein
LADAISAACCELISVLAVKPDMNFIGPLKHPR